MSLESFRCYPTAIYISKELAFLPTLNKGFIFSYLLLY
nr:MAG TPA: hypothetical protein [Caudoviricetes sp.]